MAEREGFKQAVFEERRMNAGENAQTHDFRRFAGENDFGF